MQQIGSFLKRWWWAIPATAYLLAFVVLGFRRWGCWPWTTECVSEFWRISESAILFLWVDDWESIFSTALAIIAAGAGIWFAWEQNAAARRSRFEASLGRLSHTCSALSTYLRASAATIVTVYEAKRGERIPRGTEVAEVPSFPASVIGDLSDLIDAADRETAGYARRFSNELQVQNSRLQELPNQLARPGHIVVATNIETLITDIVELDAMLAPLFSLARGEIRRISKGPSRLDIMNSMNLLGFRDEQYDRARAMLQRRYPEAD